MRSYLWVTRAAPFPPLRSGDIAYTRGMLNGLSQRAAVICLANSSAAEVPPPTKTLQFITVEHRPRSPLRGLLSHLPNAAYREYSPSLVGAVLERIGSCDAVVIDNLSMAWMIDELRQSGKALPPLVFINHNYETGVRPLVARAARNPALRAALTYDARKSAALEQRANRLVDGFTAITTTDLSDLQRLAPNSPGHLLMPGFGEPPAPLRSIQSNLDKRIVILGGRAHYYKQQALWRTLDALKSAGIDRSCIVDIVGPGLDDNAVLRSRYPTFNFIGYVPDLPAYLSTARLGLVADEIGGGFKLRALSFIFAHTPIAALGSALLGMPLTPDVDYVAAETTEHLCQRILETIDDLPLLNRVASAAFANSVNKYDWGERMTQFDEFVAAI